MTSRQAGRRMSTIASERGKRQRTKECRKRAAAGRSQTVPGNRAGRKDEPLSAREKRQLGQLVVCCVIFVALVAAKLLLPGKMAAVNEALSGALEKNLDVREVFSAVGQAVSGEDGGWENVYQAVFGPSQEESPALETSAAADLETAEEPSQGLEALQTSGGEVGWELPDDWAFPEPDSPDGTLDAQTGQTEAGASTEADGDVETLAYVLYSDQNLPEDVSMEQAILGFDYCTPVMGVVSSSFGYREHPVEGEERFHYGLDIAADTGTDIGCFADGTVTAVGESSSYGKYLMVDHGGGFTTLYAHCSKILVSSGTAVREGQAIAQVGETGVATGPHLHFEIHRDGVYLNPIYYVSLG
nr:M23 family metallopeptidase [uncultured Oscillibacter sp.]